MPSPLAGFLEALLVRGEAVLTGRPDAKPDAASRELVARAFADHALDVAGPPIVLDESAALAAAEVVRQAAWCLVQRGEPLEALERAGRALRAPESPSAHLSADLLLRFLPQLLG